jgi:hypothetical protein
MILRLATMHENGRRCGCRAEAVPRPWGDAPHRPYDLSGGHSQSSEESRKSLYFQSEIRPLCFAQGRNDNDRKVFSASRKGLLAALQRNLDARFVRLDSSRSAII